MPFPKLKVCFNRGFGSCVREVSVVDQDTGVVTTTTAPCNTKLPDAELFEIQNQIKAGVTLDEVNTKILGSGIDTVSLTEAVETVVKNSNKKSKEVNNENK